MVKKYKPNEINKLVEILKNDGVIAVPTDTVYGLCARMDSLKVRKKLEKIKERLPNKSFPVMCSNIEQIKNIAMVTKKTEKIINAFMPGPITLVLKKSENVPNYINEGSTEIGIRMATTKELKEIIELMGIPVLMTSANKSGEETCKSIEEIERVFPTIDGVLVDDLPKGKASTIIDCTSEDIRIIREGPISLDQVKEALNS